MLKEQAHSAREIWINVQRLIPFGLSIKLIFGALLAILGGAGFLGYVTDYATYWYAINSGFRAPLEGVAYLKAAVTLASIFLLVTCGFIFGISVVILRAAFGLLSLNHRLFKIILKILPDRWLIKPVEATVSVKELFEEIARDMSPEVLVKSSFRDRATTVVATITIVFLSAAFYGWLRPHMLTTTYAISAFLAVSTVAVFFPGSRWPLSFAFTISYFTLCLYLLFQPREYGWFLRTIGYGGNFEVAIQVNDEDLRRRLIGIPTLLTLRTNDTVIIFDQKNKEFLEIPRTSVVYLSYGAGQINTNRP